ncbi:MAG TPA: CBS domain-containing protein [Herpetosiphonaceae bacterium]
MNTHDRASLHVRDLMSSPAITVAPTTRLREIIVLMQDYQCHRLPVVDGTTLVGIVSLTNIRAAFPDAEATHDTAAWQVVLDTVRADEIMTTAVMTVAADAPIAEAAALMLTQRVKCLPVIDGERVVGIITDHDLIRVIPGAVENPAAAPG